MSIASEAMSPEQLDEILLESTNWNKPHHLTGCLAYVEGELKGMNLCRFIQVLEGPEEEVLGIFNRIRQDQRHMYVTVIKQGAITNRHFASWEMGLERINLNTNHEMQAYFEMDPEALADDGSVHNNMLLDFMKHFYITT